MQIINLPEVDSTNSWLAQHSAEFEGPTLLFCHEQKAGRGQKGNTWESQPGKNITASLLFYPKNFEARHQFLISEAISLAIIDFLTELGVSARVKWPNDIYVGDKKICGILVEHVITGSNISRTIAGFGININQTEFLSDAPNPISLALITGKFYNVESLVMKLSTNLEKYLGKISQDNDLHKDFLSVLWRHDGRFYKFYDHKSVEMIEARIHSVATDGVLTLETKKGLFRNYMFKEIEYIL